VSFTDEDSKAVVRDKEICVSLHAEKKGGREKTDGKKTAWLLGSSSVRKRKGC
jgi:hypothetical protein